MSFSAEELAHERWRGIEGFPGYEVSDLGRVRSLDRVIMVRSPYGEVQRKRRGQILRPGTAESGHQVVVLGRRRSRLVHTLVLETFVGPRPEGLEACHGDGDPANNRLGNLRWDTRAGNVADTVAQGKHHHGDQHREAKLRSALIPEIRRKLKTRTIRSVADEYGVSYRTMWQVKHRRTWKHVD